jgi:hypothetical protein
MVTPYHDKVRDYIYEYGKSIKKVKQRFKGSKRAISISYPYPHTKKAGITIYYEPDVYYILSGKRHVIFEVIKSQEIYKTISDFIRCYLCEKQIHSINFITHDREKRTKIMNDLDVITARLKQIIKDEEKKKFEHSAILIPESITDSEKEVYKLLDEEIMKII